MKCNHKSKDYFSECWLKNTSTWRIRFWFTQKLVLNSMLLLIVHQGILLGFRRGWKSKSRLKGLDGLLLPFLAFSLADEDVDLFSVFSVRLEWPYCRFCKVGFCSGGEGWGVGDMFAGIASWLTWMSLVFITWQSICIMVTWSRESLLLFNWWDKVCSPTQFYSVGFLQSRISVKIVDFLQTNNQDLRQLLSTDSFLGLPCLVKCPDADSVPVSLNFQKQRRSSDWGPLKGFDSAQKALQGSKAETRELLEGTKAGNTLPKNGPLMLF